MVGCPGPTRNKPPANRDRYVSRQDKLEESEGTTHKVNDVNAKPDRL